jgi:signal transduction histidine kinase
MAVDFVARLWQTLTQAEAERDPGFQEEIRRRSWQGLRVVGWALVLAPLAMAVTVRVMLPEYFPTPVGTTELVICAVAIGGSVLLTKRSAFFYDYSRTIAFLAICAASFCLTTSLLLRAASEELFLYVINGQIAVVILIGLVSVPFRPVQILLIGILTEAFFLVSYRLAVLWTVLPDDHGGDVNVVFLSMVTVLATGICVSQYRQTHESYSTHQLQLQASEEMRNTQCKVLLSDSAASMGRLAAALSHELNNPLGILKSNLDTMKELIRQREDLSPEKQAKLGEMKAKLCSNSQESVERMQETIQRMQRFTNLDRAEVMPVNISQLLQDVSDLTRDALEGQARFELDLSPVLEVRARPQLLSAVFSALLQNATEASKGISAVRVSSRLVGNAVRVEIEDRGAGMSKRELVSAMEPSFRVKGERVAACNWNLFGARQIIREHGGEIEISSEVGKGTVVAVNLPLR